MNQLQKNIALWLVISLVFVLLYHLFTQPKGQQESVVYSDFVAYVERGQVREVTIQGDNVTGKLTDGKNFKTFMPKDATIVDKLKAANVRIAAKPAEDSPWYMTILISWFPMLLLIGVWIFFMRQMQGGGGKAMAFGKSRARLMTDQTNKVTFEDVAGLSEGQARIQAGIAISRGPPKFSPLGGRVPNGLPPLGHPGPG